METTLKDFQFYLLKQAFSGNTEKRDLILEFVDKVLLVEIKKYGPDYPVSSLNASSLEVKRTVIQDKKPSLDKPSLDKPSLEKPSLEKPSLDKPSLEKPSLEKPSLEKPRGKKRVIVSKSGKRTEFIPSLEEKTVTITRNRSGNGHKKAIKRKLYGWEKNIIRNEFLLLNGQIYENACLRIKKRCGKEVTIFQVTGFVTLLHKYVSLGKLEVPDMTSYVTHLRQKRKLWAQYEKNRAQRAA